MKAALLEDARRKGHPGSTFAIEQDYSLLLRRRQARENLAEMRQLGATVNYRETDVLDDTAFGALIEGIYRTYPAWTASFKAPA